MRTLELKRINFFEDGTFGELSENGKRFAVTCERPWFDNQEGISCIPAGTYLCKRIISPRHGVVFEITEVPSRTHVLIHIGNTMADTEGCILIGQVFGKIKGINGVLASTPAFTLFMERMGEDNFTLNIINAEEHPISLTEA